MLNKLATKPGRARELYGKIMSSWGQRPDRQRVTLKLGERDLQVLEGLNLRDGVLGRDVLPSGYLAVYQHPRNSQLEVTIHSKDKPPKRRTLKVGGKKRQLVRVSLRRIEGSSTHTNHTKEATVATKTRKKAKQEEEDLDELEGLEDLEDLDDEDVDEEPEDEDVEDEEDEEPAPKRRGKAKPAAKKAPAKKTTRKRAPEPEEDEDDEDEEDEEPAPKRTAKSKTAKTTSNAKTAAKSSSKSSGKKDTGKKGNGNLPAARELPKGQVGPSDIAEMVGEDCDARYVRIFLRDNYERPDGGRWAFSKTDARTIAKEIRNQRKRNA